MSPFLTHGVVTGQTAANTPHRYIEMVYKCETSRCIGIRP